MKQAKLLTQVEQKRVTAIINSHRYQVRNHTIFAFSFFAGLRACEIAALKVGDVFDVNGEVRDTVYLTATQTKGDEGNTVLVSKRLSKALMLFAAQYPHHTANPTAQLFFSAKRGGFSAQTIVNLFARFYALAGIKGADRKSTRLNSSHKPISYAVFCLKNKKNKK